MSETFEVLTTVIAKQYKQQKLRGNTIISGNQINSEYMNQLVTTMAQFTAKQLQMDRETLSEETQELLAEMRAFVALVVVFGAETQPGVRTDENQGVTRLYTPSVVAIEEQVGLLFGGSFVPLEPMPMDNNIGVLWVASKDVPTDPESKACIRLVLTTDTDKTRDKHEYCYGKLKILIFDDDGNRTFSHQLIGRVAVRFESTADGEKDLYTATEVCDAFGNVNVKEVAKMLAETPNRQAIKGVSISGKEVTIAQSQAMVECPFGVYEVYDVMKTSVKYTDPESKAVTNNMKYFMQIRNHLDRKVWVKIDVKTFNASRVTLGAISPDQFDQMMMGENADMSVFSKLSAVFVYLESRDNSMTTNDNRQVSWKSPVGVFEAINAVPGSFSFMSLQDFNKAFKQANETPLLNGSVSTAQLTTVDV